MIDPVYVIQKRLQDDQRSYRQPEKYFEPSPGQLLDHVNHRVARLAVEALQDSGLLPNPRRGAETSRDPEHFTGPLRGPESREGEGWGA